MTTGAPPVQLTVTPPNWTGPMVGVLVIIRTEFRVNVWFEVSSLVFVSSPWTKFAPGVAHEGTVKLQSNCPKASGVIRVSRDPAPQSGPPAGVSSWPSNVTSAAAGPGLKSNPEIVNDDPTEPLLGLSRMVGKIVNAAVAVSAGPPTTFPTAEMVWGPATPPDTMK